jgi:transposase
MDKSSTSQPSNWREARRLQAWKLKQKGWSQKAIAEALGVSPGAVSQWMSKARAGGEDALRHRDHPGATPRLTAEQKQHLVALLEQGAEAHGFQGDAWTQPRVARLIKRVFGVSYHPRHMGRLLKSMGWSAQKPTHRASQRNEAAIERWRTENWDELKKKPAAKDEPSCL